MLELKLQHLRGCKLAKVQGHPARFPAKLPEFFVRFLTDPGDLVIDIFAGSNTTGSIAEAEGRRWLAFDLNREYLAASAFRFLASDASESALLDVHESVLTSGDVNLTERMREHRLFA